MSYGIGPEPAESMGARKAGFPEANVFCIAKSERFPPLLIEKIEERKYEEFRFNKSLFHRRLLPPRSSRNLIAQIIQHQSSKFVVRDHCNVIQWL